MGKIKKKKRGLPGSNLANAGSGFLEQNYGYRQLIDDGESGGILWKLINRHIMPM